MVAQAYHADSIGRLPWWLGVSGRRGYLSYLCCTRCMCLRTGGYGAVRCGRCGAVRCGAVRCGTWRGVAKNRSTGFRKDQRGCYCVDLPRMRGVSFSEWIRHNFRRKQDNKMDFPNEAAAVVAGEATAAVTDEAATAGTDEVTPAVTDDYRRSAPYCSRRSRRCRYARSGRCRYGRSRRCRYQRSRRRNLHKCFA